jgi:hypothetical protein
VALLAQHLVFMQRRCDVVRAMAQALREDEAVLHGHGAALGQKGQHRMRGIAKKGGAPVAPARKRLAIQERPFVAALGGAEEREQ